MGYSPYFLGPPEGARKVVKPRVGVSVLFVSGITTGDKVNQHVKQLPSGDFSLDLLPFRDPPDDQLGLRWALVAYTGTSSSPN